MTKTITPSPELITILTPAFERKAQSITALNVRELTSYTDTVVVITGTSTRQVTAIAEHLNISMKNIGMTTIGKEGIKEGRWVLLDYGHIISHVSDTPTGQAYDLTGLWSDAPKYDLSELEKQYPLEGAG